MVIVDCLIKQAIFIPTHQTINTPTIAKLFVVHVFSKYRIPSHVISDQGLKFVSRFFHSLAATLDMKLHFTSDYHSERDGQTEHTNQTLEQYLRIYCNYQQFDWSCLLPLAEFAYNNTMSATTGLTPFFTNKRYHSSLQTQLEHDLPFDLAQPFIAELESVHTRLKQSIVEAQACYQGLADAKYSVPFDIKVEDPIFILAKNI